MRILVCGGRDYNDRDHIHNTLCQIDAERGPITCVIHGTASGADHEGMIWAQMMATIPGRKITHAPFAAEWDNINVPGAVIKYHRNGRPYMLLPALPETNVCWTKGAPIWSLCFQVVRGPST